MKIKITTLFLCMFFLSLAFGVDNTPVSASLSWDANPETDIDYYTIHWGIAPRVYSGTLNVGNVTGGRVTGLSKLATYYFAVTATNKSGLKSEYSDEVSSKYTEPVVPTKPPPYSIANNSLKVSSNGAVEMDVSGIPGGYCTVETSYDLVRWQPLTELEFDVDQVIRVMIQPPASGKPAPRQFFRIKWEEGP